jgi:tetratricopeptide (TPR) repeat protein
LAHFEFNLRRMARLAADCSAQILFVAPACNLKDCSPFKSETSRDFTPQQSSDWGQIFRRGRTLADGKSWAEALQAFDEALAFDDRYAGLHYHRGEALFALGRHAEAEAAFRRACDEDVCPLRAVSEVVQIVRQVAREEQVAIVEFDRLLEALARERLGHALLGRELFLDHVHPTIEGYRLLAAAIVDELEQQDIVRPVTGWRETIMPRVAQRVEAAIDPRDHATALRTAAQVLDWAGKNREAGPLALQALQTLPDDRTSLYIAGEFLKRTGREDESLALYRRALEQDVAGNPQDVEARLFLGDVYVRLGEQQAALAQFEAALALKPEHGDTRRRLGLLLADLGRTQEAGEHLTAALRMNPQDGEVRDRLRSLFQP